MPSYCKVPTAAHPWSLSTCAPPNTPHRPPIRSHTSTISFYFPAFNSILHHRPRSTRPMASRPSVKGRPGRNLSDHDSSSSRSQSSEAPRPFACDWNNRGRGAQCEKVRTAQYLRTNPPSLCSAQSRSGHNVLFRAHPANTVVYRASTGSLICSAISVFIPMNGRMSALGSTFAIRASSSAVR